MSEERICRCLRCGYEWIPRVKGRPKSCPNCHSYRWDKEKCVKVL